MTGHDVALVQEHYDDLRPVLRALTQSFYEVLFERAPELRPLFPPDLAFQHSHFAAALQLAIEHLGRFPAIDTTLRELGVRHLRYGAQPQHYAVARDAFLVVLERHSGDRWTPPLASAWHAAFGAISAAMLRGAALETAAHADAFEAERPGVDT